MSIRTGFAALLLVLSVSTLHAQPVAQPVLGGVPLYCNGPTGIVYTVGEPMNDWGRAEYRMGQFGPVPLIVLNPAVVYSLPPAVQHFLYGHECMHHMLGHTLGNITLSMEVDADCSAIRVLRDQGFLNQYSVAQVASYFQNNPPNPPFYPAGPERAARLVNCFSQ